MENGRSAEFIPHPNAFLRRADRNVRAPGSFVSFVCFVDHLSPDFLNHGSHGSSRMEIGRSAEFIPHLNAFLRRADRNVRAPGNFVSFVSFAVQIPETISPLTLDRPQFHTPEKDLRTFALEQDRTRVRP